MINYCHRRYSLIYCKNTIWFQESNWVNSDSYYCKTQFASKRIIESILIRELLNNFHEFASVLRRRFNFPMFAIVLPISLATGLFCSSYLVVLSISVILNPSISLDCPLSPSFRTKGVDDIATGSKASTFPWCLRAFFFRLFSPILTLPSVLSASSRLLPFPC